MDINELKVVLRKNKDTYRPLIEYIKELYRFDINILSDAQKEVSQVIQGQCRVYRSILDLFDETIFN